MRGIGHTHGRRLNRDTLANERAGGVARCALGETKNGSEPRKAEIRQLMFSHILRNSTVSEVTLFAKRNTLCAD